MQPQHLRAQWSAFVQSQSRNLGDSSNNHDESDWSSTEEEFSCYFVIFLTLLGLCLVLSKFLDDRPKMQYLLPEAGMTVIVGLVASAMIWLAAPFLYNNEEIAINGDQEQNDFQVEDVAYGLLSFSSTFFFMVLLPPIIFNSGYHVNRLLFFRHIRPIILYSIVGTFVNIFVMASFLNYLVQANLTGGFKPHFSELLTFGSLIASTDPVATLAVFQKKRVDPQLFYLVFGESVLNDGVCLVLFGAFSKIVGNEDNFDGAFHAALTIFCDFLVSFSGSLFLGLVSGLGAALIYKVVDMRETRLLEVSLYILVMYFPFFLAEAVDLSGIVTILFTGISAKRYAEPNLSVETQNEADVLFRVTAHLSETAIFLELGLSVFGLGLSSFEDFYIQFVAWSLLACLVGRACSIYPMTFVNNQCVKCELPPPEDVEDIDLDGSVGYVSMSVGSALSTETYHLDDRFVNLKTAHMLWFSGLRGAVAYACAKNFPDGHGNQNTFVNITMFIILISLFCLGSTTEFFLNSLNIDTGVDEDKYVEKSGKEMRGGWLRHFNQKYICPCVIRDFKPTYSVPDRNEMLKHTIEESLRELVRVNSIEMTLEDHEYMLRKMGRTFSQANLQRQSLYDYGG